MKHAQELNFDMSIADAELIGKITRRGREMAEQAGTTFDHMTAVMDICAVHCNGTPLELWQMLASSQDDFSHDFCGIGLHVDRKNGKLKNGFAPRCAKK